MEVRLLGEIAATTDCEVAVGGPTQRRVLAALALRPNEAVSVAALVDVVWGDEEPPDRAEHNVRTYVHRLRTALGDEGDRIKTVPGGYRLQLDVEDLDIARFERNIETGVRLLDTADIVGGLDRLDAAASLWKGDPLAEFTTESWAQPTAVRLLELRSRLRERRAQALLESGRSAEAVADLEEFVRVAPLRERPRALLMRALYESGRQAEALRSFQDYRRYLVDETGTEPSADLRQLDRDIASGRLSGMEPVRAVGAYELHERIGEGAFAVVHRATHKALGREVAVKIVRAELANDPEFIRRFEAEAQMVARIEHPSIVPLYDYWREPDRAFLVMRWMTGGSLEQRLGEGTLPLEEVLEIVDQIAAGLDAAHDLAVVHRDVKPENILFDDADRAFLGDFGVALMTDERQRPEAAPSEGSPLFASPEQLRGEPAGPEADVYALGIVAYTMLAGRTPFWDAANEQELLRRQIEEPVPPVSDVRPEASARVDKALATATAKAPHARFPSASGFAHALRAAATDAAPPTREGRERINPYRGLAAFGESDATQFHGRSRIAAELLEQFRGPEAGMVAIVGPSGSGKSSVARAGVLAALRTGAIAGSDEWFTTSMTPGARPFEALETALLRIAVNPPNALLDQLRDGDRGLLRTVRRLLPTDDGTVLVLIDQFEELFTQTSPELTGQFLRALTEAITEPGSPLRVVLTLRADFYDRPLLHERFAPLLKRHTVVLTPLDPDELERAIVAPAESVGIGFERGLVAEIVAEVHDQPGALPLMQYALTRAFDATSGDLITVETWHEIGGLTGALSRQAEALWETAPPEEQAEIRRLFGRLVGVDSGSEDTRRRVPRSELGAGRSIESALDRFGAARLLTFDHDPGTRQPTVEVAHEALIREWDRLQSWLDDDRDALRAHRHLTRAANAWAEGGRDDGDLYRGSRLELAEGLGSLDTLALNDVERAFVDTSVAARIVAVDQERRRVQRLRRLLVLAAAVAGVAMIASIVAVSQQRRADDEAARADLRRMTAEAPRLAEGDRSLGLLVAAEAHRRDPSVLTLSALQRTLVGLPRGWLGAVQVDGELAQAQISRSGNAVALLTDAGLRLHALPGRELMADLETDLDTAVAISADASLVALGGSSGDWAVANTATTEILGTGRVAGAVTVIGFSPDGRRIALGSSTGDVTVAGISSGARVVGSLEGRVDDLDWAANGGRVIAGGGETAIARVFDVDTGQVVGPDLIVQGPVTRGSDVVAFVGDDVAIANGPVLRFDPETGEETGRLAQRDLDARVMGDIVWLGGSEILVSGNRGVFRGDLDTGDLERVATLAGATSVNLAENGRTVTGARSQGFVDVFDHLGGNRVLGRALPSDGRAVALSSDGSYIATGFLSRIRVWGLGGPEPELLRQIDDGTYVRIRGNTMWIGAPPGGQTELWSPADGSDVFPSVGGIASTVGLSPDGGLLVHPDRENHVTYVVDARTREPIAELTDIRDMLPQTILDSGSIPAMVTDAEFSPDGSRLVLGSIPNYAAVYDTSTWELVRPVLGPKDGFMDIAWSADGALAVTLTSGGTVAIRDGHDLSVQAGPVTLQPSSRFGGKAVAMSPDGSIAMSSSAQGQQLWEPATLAPIGDPFPHEDSSQSGELAPDTMRLATIVGGDVVIWEANPARWIDLACDAAGRNLTQAEWLEYGPRGKPWRATCSQWS